VFGSLQVQKKVDPINNNQQLNKIKMRTILKNYLTWVLLIACFAACNKRNNNIPESPFFDQADQAARPAINTVFISPSGKDSFNVTVPSQMAATFSGEMKSNLLALNPGYTTNLLGLTADQFIGVVSTDVLNASTTGTTTFYDGTNVLTGRALGDDVIDVELTLIFGGPDGSANPGLTSDHVNANDVPFLTDFPYLAQPH
jgi:hypothetical protein